MSKPVYKIIQIAYTENIRLDFVLSNAVSCFLAAEYSGLGDTTVLSFGNRYSGIKETAIPVLETNHIVP